MIFLLGCRAVFSRDVREMEVEGTIFQLEANTWSRALCLYENLIAQGLDVDDVEAPTVIVQDDEG